MIGLSTLITLAGIDDQGTGEHHLRQSEDGTKTKSLEHNKPELNKLAALSVDIIEHAYEGTHSQDGPDTNHVSAIMLNEE